MDYSYTINDLLNNPKQISEKRAKLETTINELKEAYTLYAARLKEIESMSNIVKTACGGFISLFHDKGGGTSIPKPFRQNIFLFDPFVAGTTHIEGIEELASHLNIDDKPDFFREPNNPQDSKAILIKNSNGIKIGYMPKNDNTVFSCLMDAWKLLFGI